MIDISDWEADFSYQVSGTREKFWIKPGNEINNERFLFKIPKSNSGENWAEKIPLK